MSFWWEKWYFWRVQHHFVEQHQLNKLFFSSSRWVWNIMGKHFLTPAWNLKKNWAKALYLKQWCRKVKNIGGASSAQLWPYYYRCVGNYFVDLFKYKLCKTIMDTFKWYMTTCYTWNIAKNLKKNGSFWAFAILHAYRVSHLVLT